MNINSVTSNERLIYKMTKITSKQLGRITRQSNMDTLGMMYNCHHISQYCMDFAAADSSCCQSKCFLPASVLAR